MLNKTLTSQLFPEFPMRHAITLVLLSLFLATASFGQPAKKRIDLPNGWHLTPAGHGITLGDLPLNIAISPKGDYAAVTNNGESDQSIELIDIKNAKVLDSVAIAKSWLGLQFSADGKRLYASGGNDNKIIEYAIRKNKIDSTKNYVLGPDTVLISPAGVALDEVHNRMYVVTKEDSCLYVFDLAAGNILKKLFLGAQAYTCLLSPDHAMLYISVWGDDKVSLYDTQLEKLSGSIDVGRNPNDMCLTRDGRFLFVANSVDNNVSVIDLKVLKNIETLNAALYPDALQGSTTNSVALSSDNKTLYIANADNNCLAVFDVSKPGQSASKGFIPTGWYPTCVRVVRHTLLVANGKGFQSLPDPYGPNPMVPKQKANIHTGETVKKQQYIGGLFRGTLSFIPEPDGKHLATYSQSVYANSPYTKERETTSEGMAGNPVPMKLGDPSPIKHVFYVIKENRTYDQVMGDHPQGNGDTSLCLFPRKITPNMHALADEFVLLDNFYVNAEVSADGHNWSMGAYATDYIEKTWPTLYGNRGGNFDYNGYRKLATPKGGYIWDNALRHNVTLRNYGEMADLDAPFLKPLLAHTCMPYPGFDMGILDTLRERIWEHDFDSLLAANAVPQLNILYLPHDHTSGLAKDAYTPYAAMADNDLAVGQCIAHLAQSPIWKESAVFVLEDDAQAGPDHVDAHRATAFIAGGFVKRGFVDHTMYSTMSMLRTMELILGLPPMSQYDAGATSMWRCFTDSADARPYLVRNSNVNLSDRNIAFNELMDKFKDFDLTHPDNVPDITFNNLLWEAIKGKDVPIPPLTRSAFVNAGASEADEDGD